MKFNCDTVMSEHVLTGMLPMTVCGMLPLFVVQRGNVLYKGQWNVSIQMQIGMFRFMFQCF